MTQLATPAARRLRRPSWRDRRLAVGLLLVLVSIVLATVLLSRANDTVPMLAARHTLVPGQALGAGDVRVVNVRLAGGQARYLAGGRPLPDGAVLIRTVSAGELVPVSAIGRSSDVDVRPISLALGSGAGHDVRAGTLVDVWVAAPGPRAGVYAAPVKVVSAATVASVSQDSGVLSAGSGASVDVLLDQTQVPQILAAVDGGARISVVPLPGSAPRGGS